MKKIILLLFICISGYVSAAENDSIMVNINNPKKVASFLLKNIFYYGEDASSKIVFQSGNRSNGEMYFYLKGKILVEAEWWQGTGFANKFREIYYSTPGGQAKVKLFPEGYITYENQDGSIRMRFNPVAKEVKK